MITRVLIRLFTIHMTIKFILVINNLPFIIPCDKKGITKYKNMVAQQQNTEYLGDISNP
jgi:hypothetical protein